MVETKYVDVERIVEGKTVYVQVPVIEYVTVPPETVYVDVPVYIEVEKVVPVEVVKTVTVLPKLPETTYGGWYGSVVGRSGDISGVDYWSNAIKNGVTTTEAANIFLDSAAANYNTEIYRTAGYESIFNPVSVSELTKNNILTSTTVNNYVGNSIVATTSGVKLDGTSFVENKTVITW